MARQQQQQNVDPRYSVPLKRKDRHTSANQTKEEPVRRREKTQHHQSRSRPKSDYHIQNGQLPPDPRGDYEGFYSPKAESRQRELAQRPLPEIKVPETEGVPHVGHHREDTDDGYSTLTKYHDQKRRQMEDLRERLKESLHQNQPPEPGQGHPGQPQYFYEQEQVPVSNQDNSHMVAPGEGPHTYVNFPEKNNMQNGMQMRSDYPDGVQQRVPDYHDDMPGRPPLPVAVRSQIVEEIAEAKTPHSRVEMLNAEKNLERRMQQPAYFKYPTPDVHSKVRIY